MRGTSLAFVSATVALLQLAAATSPRAARAEGPSSSFTVAQQQEAEDRFREGRALYEDGKVEEARLKYAQAYAVLGRSNILWNLAVAEFHSNRFIDALRHFKEYTKRSDALADDVKRAREKYIPDADLRTGHLKIDAPPGTEVIVEGELQAGATPFPDTIDVGPGSHKLEARYRGKSYPMEIGCAAGQTITVKFEITVPRETTVIAVPTEEAPTTYAKGRVLTTVILAAAAAGATAAGVVFALDSQSRDSDNKAFVARQPGGFCVDQASPGCADWKSKLDGQASSATMSQVFYVGGGVLAASAIVTFFVWPKTRGPSEKRASALPWIAPVVGNGGGGVQLGGRF